MSPEQIIKEVTGHRSDCVRNYKRTSDELREEASHAISENVNKKQKIEEKSVVGECSKNIVKVESPQKKAETSETKKVEVPLHLVWRK